MANNSLWHHVSGYERVGVVGRYNHQHRYGGGALPALVERLGVGVAGCVGGGVLVGTDRHEVDQSAHTSTRSVSDILLSRQTFNAVKAYLSFTILLDCETFIRFQHEVKNRRHRHRMGFMCAQWSW